MEDRLRAIHEAARALGEACPPITPHSRRCDCLRCRTSGWWELPADPPPPLHTVAAWLRKHASRRQPAAASFQVVSLTQAPPPGKTEAQIQVELRRSAINLTIQMEADSTAAGAALERLAYALRRRIDNNILGIRSPSREFLGERSGQSSVRYNFGDEYYGTFTEPPPPEPPPRTDREDAINFAQFAPRPFESQQQRAAQARREQQSADYLRSQARQATAQARAEVLLRAVLTPVQCAQYDAQGWFEVTGSQGGRYRIYAGRAGNVRALTGPTMHDRLCAVPQGAGLLPVADVMLAQALVLQTDEAAFLEVAKVV